MVYEYLDQNSRLKYPFEDRTSLVTPDGELANSCFLDVQVTSKTRPFGWANLSKFSTLSGDLELEFSLWNKDGSLLDAITLIIPFQDITPKSVVTETSSESVVKVIFGEGILEYKDKAVEYTFDKLKAVLCVSATVCPNPVVSSLIFENYSNTSKDFVTSPDLTFSSGDIKIFGGANLDITLLNNLTLDVNVGGGTGLFNACKEFEGNIKFINDTPPTNSGNFIFNTGDCYVQHSLENGLYIENICTPKCTNEQIRNTANYMLRVKDGLATVINYAGSIRDKLTDAIDDYVTNVRPNQNKPYYKVAHSDFSGTEAFAVGFYNRSKEEIELDITITAPNMVDVKYRIGQGDTVNLGNGAVKVVKVNVPCMSALYLNFAVLPALTRSVSINGTFGSTSVSYSKTL